MSDTHILVVEDQRAVAGALRMRLRGLGYDVLDIAKNGTEAVEKAGALRPDLILMDIRLGEGIDGIEAATRIRSQFDIPVVYVTAFADNDLLDRARATHPAGFINKPYTTKDLLTTINLALHHETGFAQADTINRDRLREAVLTTDREGHISFLSSGAEQLTGWSRNLIIGQPLSVALTMLYPLAPAAAQQLVNKVIDEGLEQVLHRRSEGADEPGDVLTPLSDADGTRFGAALRFNGNTVESSFAALQRVADSCRFALDQVPIGVILVDHNLKIYHVNAHAEEIVTANDALGTANGHVRVLDDARNDALRQIVRRLASGRHDDENPQSELISLTLDDDTPRVVAIAAPVPQSDAFTGAPMVALMLFDLQYRRPLSSSVLQKMYALTRSEVKLVQTLVGGCSLEDGAHELGISVNTARTHLKHIFHKTGARRQSELIHQIETGPASLALPIVKN